MENTEKKYRIIGRQFDEQLTIIIFSSKGDAHSDHT